MEGGPSIRNSHRPVTESPPDGLFNIETEAALIPSKTTKNLFGTIHAKTVQVS